MSTVDNTMDEQPTDEEMALWLRALERKASAQESSQPSAVSGKMVRDALMFEYERVNAASANQVVSPEAVRAYEEFVASAVRRGDIAPARRPMSPWLNWAPPLAVAFTGLFAVMLPTAPPVADVSEQRVGQAESAPVTRGADRRIASVDGNPIIYFKSRDPITDASLLSGKLRKLGLHPNTEYRGVYVQVSFELPINLVNVLSEDLEKLGLINVAEGFVSVRISK